MSVLVWVEHGDGAVKDATLATVTAGSKLGTVDLLVAGQGVDGIAQSAAKIAGAGKVLVADDAVCLRSCAGRERGAADRQASRWL